MYIDQGNPWAPHLSLSRVLSFDYPKWLQNVIGSQYNSLVLLFASFIIDVKSPYSRSWNNYSGTLGSLLINIREHLKLGNESHKFSPT